MSDWLTPTPRPNSWPRPPAAIPAARLVEPSAGARVCVAGLVLVRQRPGTAKGVVWATVYERFRRAVIAGRLLRVTGRLQREAGVIHIVAENIEDLSPLARHPAAPRLPTRGCPGRGSALTTFAPGFPLWHFRSMLRPEQSRTKPGRAGTGKNGNLQADRSADRP